MRKKYLSALLFGALLVTSAGTFTSCKDYDDDIKNLQGQIDVIKTDLASLTETVKNLDGVKDMSFDKETGKLYIETGEGKKVEVDIPSADGIAKIELKDNVLYVNDDPKGEVVIPEDKDVVVEVREDGKLYINDEVQDLEIGSKVVMVDNGNYYTMTIDGKESYNLPKYNAASAITSIEVNGDFTALGSTTNGIYWGKAAAKNDDWKGSLGKIAANQFLIGQIEKVEVDIQPLSFDLESAKLRLVDSEGKEAPVTVKATALNAEGPITSGSRAADAQGKYLLSIEMKDDVTADNIDKIFTYNEENVSYALEVDGAVVTPYQTVINTGENATTSAPNTINIAANEAFSTSNVYCNGEPLYTDTKFDAGKSYTFTSTDASVCDAYIEFAEAEDKVKAEQWGLSIEGTTLKTTEKAADGEIDIKLHVLGVNGTVVSSSSAYTVKFNASEAGESDVVTISPTTYKLDAATNNDNQYVNIDIKVADVMKNLTIDEVTKITALSVEEIKDQVGFLFDFTRPNYNGVKYYKAKSDGKIDTASEITIDAASGNIRDIAYVRLTGIYTTGPSSAIASDAKPGEYKLELKLKESATGNEVKKIVMPINITLPSFSDLYTRTDQWTGDTYSAQLLDNMTFNYSFAFNKAKDNDGYKYDKLAVAFKAGDKAISSNANLADTGVATFNNTDKDLIKDGKFNATELTTTLTYKFYGLDEFKVETTFTTELHSIFEEPKLVYYVNGVVQDKAVLGADNKIAAMTVSATGVKNGLAIQYGRGEDAFIKGKVIDGVKIEDKDETPANKVVKSVLSVKNYTGTEPINWVDTTGEITIPSAIQSGTLVVKFTDANGIITETSINFE